MVRNTTQGAVSGLPRKLFLLAVMYFCQAIPMGYVFGSMPVIMREAGVSLASIGGLFVLHLPWAFKFLIASRVDRHYIAALGRRRSWIFPLQWVAACLLLVAAHTPPDTAYQAMFAVFLVLNIVMATNDIAVDGYATDMLEDHERPWGNTVQAGARYVGLFLGGGLMLTLHHSLGWQFLCNALAVAVFLFSLPVVLHREIAPVHPQAAGEEPTLGAWSFLRQRKVLRLLPVLIGPTAFAFSAYQMRSTLFVDLGLDASSIGRLTMQYAVPMGAVGTVAVAWVLNRFGSRFFMRLFCFMSIALSASAVWLSVQGSVPFWGACVVLVTDNILIGGANVWGFTLMMRVSAGRNAGTGFAVLSSLFILFPLGVAPFLGKLGDMYGFTALYALLACCIAAGYVAAEATLHFCAESICGKKRGRTGSLKHPRLMTPAFEEIGHDG